MDNQPNPQPTWSPRDEWPSLRLTFELAPWCWRWWFWRDEDMTSSFTAILGPLSVNWTANRPAFKAVSS